MSEKEKEHRTLMLEPQWHPIQGLKNLIQGFIAADPGIYIGYAFLWDVVVPCIVVSPPPHSLAQWPWWRVALLGLGFAPLIIVLLVCTVIVLMSVALGLKWLCTHPPFKVKTRYMESPHRSPTKKKNA